VVLVSAVGAVLVLRGAAGCSPFERASPVVDASADASTPSSGGDASPVDAQAGDAEGGKDAGCPRFPGAVLCDDFDDGTLAKWTVVGGPPVILPNGYSPPNAVNLLLPVSAVAIHLDNELPHTSHARISLRLWFHAPTAGVIDVVTYRVRQPTNLDEYTLSLVRQGGTWQIEEYSKPSGGQGGSIQTNNLQKPIPSDQWTNVVLDCDLGAKTLSVVVDDVALGQRTIAPPSAWTGGSISIGAPYTQDLPAGYEIRMDDVHVEQK